MAAGNVIRELLVALGVKVDPKSKKELKAYDKAIDDVKDKMEAAAGWALRLGVALAGAVVAGATAAAVLARDVGQQAEQIERQARALQLTRTEYQELTSVFATFGSDTGDIADAFGTLADRAQDALDGTQSMVDDFRLIGLGADQLRNKRPIELFETFADAVAGASDRNKALTATVRLLGDDLGARLAPMLADGAAGIRRLRQEAHELGVVMDDDALRTAKQVQLEWRRLTNIARGLRNEIGVLLAPAVSRSMRAFSEWVRVNRELIGQRVELLIRTLTTAFDHLNMVVSAVGGWDVVFLNVAAGTGVLLLIANLGKVEATLGVVRVLVAGLEVAFAAAGATISIPFLPILGILALLAAAITLVGLAVNDLWVWWQGGNSVLGANLDMVESILPAFGAVRDLVWSLVEAFASGWTNVLGFARAIANGLRPALALVDLVLAPFVRRLQMLVDLWKEFNDRVAAPIANLAGTIHANTTASAVADAANANSLQRQIATGVQGQVDRAAMGIYQLDRAAPGATTINQSNTFMGGRGWEVDEAMQSAYRLAAPAVAGGRR